jgi:hypothetical protein
MIPKYRTLFNKEFSQEKYQKVNELIKEKCGHEAGFDFLKVQFFLPKNFGKSWMMLLSRLFRKSRNA